MLHDDREMLIPAKVRCPGAADFFERTIAARLRPAVAIEIRE
jgi:hypothetical protein